MAAVFHGRVGGDWGEWVVWSGTTVMGSTVIGSNWNYSVIRISFSVREEHERRSILFIPPTTVTIDGARGNSRKRDKEDQSTRKLQVTGKEIIRTIVC